LFFFRLPPRFSSRRGGTLGAAPGAADATGRAGYGTPDATGRGRGGPGTTGRGRFHSGAAGAGRAELGAGAWDAAAARFREALATPGVARRTWTLAFGDSPGDQAMRVAIIEFQQHAWDIARATGQNGAFDPAIAEAARQAAEGLIATFGRQENVFGPEVPCPDDAPAEDRLAAFLGRQL